MSSGIARDMARPIRVECAGAVYHVMARGEKDRALKIRLEKLRTHAKRKL
jgi:hypothetical protein